MDHHAYCPRYRTTYTSLMPLHRLPRILNDLSDDIRSIKSLSKFKTDIRSAKLIKYVKILDADNVSLNENEKLVDKK